MPGVLFVLSCEIAVLTYSAVISFVKAELCSFVNFGDFKDLTQAFICGSLSIMG